MITQTYNNNDYAFDNPDSRRGSSEDRADSVTSAAAAFEEFTSEKSSIFVSSAAAAALQKAVFFRGTNKDKIAKLRASRDDSS